MITELQLLLIWTQNRLTEIGKKSDNNFNFMCNKSAMSGVWQGYTPTHTGCINPLRSAPTISILSNFQLQYLMPKFQIVTSRDKAAESDIEQPATSEQPASLWYQEQSCN